RQRQDQDHQDGQHPNGQRQIAALGEVAQAPDAGEREASRLCRRDFGHACKASILYELILRSSPERVADARKRAYGARLEGWRALRPSRRRLRRLLRTRLSVLGNYCRAYGYQRVNEGFRMQIG